MADDAFAKLLGSCIGGTGAPGARTVYAVKGDPDVVIKEADNPAANRIEARVWDAIRGTTWESDFGRVISISDSGRFLMMERLNDITRQDAAHTPTLPIWLTDVWWPNMGRNAEGKIKIRDYASIKSAPTPNAEGYRMAWQGKEATK